MSDIVGQISLFDLLNATANAEPTKASIPILLKPQQDVYLVEKGEVVRYKVLDETWLCGADNFERGYRLQHECGTYNATWNTAIGTTCFNDYSSAEGVAKEYRIGRDIIFAEDIKAISTVAYSYVRECDNRTMVAFYSELENGMVYIKEFMTYHHIIVASKKKKAIKKFLDQREFENSEVKEIEYVPTFKNMYRVRQNDNWDYAEAGYNLAIG